MANRKKVMEKKNPAFAENSYPKGQMFILAAVLMIGGMVMIFNVLGVPFITEEKQFQDTMMPGKSAKNILNEYMFAMGIATNEPKANESAMKYIANFSLYIRNSTSSRIFYAIAFVNSTTQNYSVTLGNYLDTWINATVSATNSAPSSASAVLADKSQSTLYFSPAAGTVYVNISYRRGNEDVLERFPVVISGKNFMQGFFDITLLDGFSINAKELYNRTW